MSRRAPPTDNRRRRSPFWYMSQAPPGATLEEVARAYREQLDPEEVWPDA